MLEGNLPHGEGILILLLKYVFRKIHFPFWYWWKSRK